MARVLNTSTIVLRMERMTPAMRDEISGELSVCGQLIARRQRLLAPKFRSLLVNSISAEKTGELQVDVGPTAEYAGAQEEGVKAGGKGLPRFLDPAATDVIGWLQTKAFANRGRVRKGTRAALMANLELRDRYEGLAWHVRHKGVKATPFIARSLQDLEGEITRRVQAAAERGLQKGTEGV